MYYHNSNPTISDHHIGRAIKGISESSESTILVFCEDSTLIILDCEGHEVRRYSLFEGAMIVSINEYEDQIWLTTTEKKIVVFSRKLEIIDEYFLENNAVSVAPLEDRSGVVITYHDQAKMESRYEYRSLTNFEVLATGFYGPSLQVISSVAFKYGEELYVACCSKKELCLLKHERGELVLLSEYSEAEEHRPLNFSKLLAYSKRFLIDNMTGLVKTDISADKYMSRITFMRHDEKEYGSVAQRENWIAFLNPNELKLIDYTSKKSDDFKVLFDEPVGIKIFKYHVICCYSKDVVIYDFRSNSLKLIMS